MEKKASCRGDVEDCRALATDETVGMLLAKTKDNTGIVAEDGRLELQ